MSFRIMQLQYETMEGKAKIKQGILLKRPYQQITMNFCKITSTYAPQKEDLEVTTINDYSIVDREDGFKEIVINPPHEPYCMSTENEQCILLIIEYAEKIVQNENRRIAGRYCDEGIFLLKKNEKISVTKGSITEEFVALEFEGKMYLLKLYEN